MVEEVQVVVDKENVDPIVAPDAAVEPANKPVLGSIENTDNANQVGNQPEA